MLAVDELRIVLETEAVATANALGLIMQLDDEPFDRPSSGVWTHFWHECGSTELMELGGAKSYERTLGLIQWTVYAPEKEGMGEASRIAALIKRRWNRRQYQVGAAGYVTLEPMSTRRMKKAYGGYNPIICDATFAFTHRDPDAPDFIPLA